MFDDRLSRMVESVDGWVWEEHVIRALQHLAHMIGYSFDDLDTG
jgi:hypothetical protein